MSHIDALLEAIGKSRRSDRDISIAAVGHASAVRNLKHRRDLRASTLEALCEELGLEFYVGPPRAMPAEIARALGLSETCSIQDALLAIGALMLNRAAEAGESPTAGELASSILAHREETRDGFDRLERWILRLAMASADKPAARKLLGDVALQQLYDSQAEFGAPGDLGQLFDKLKEYDDQANSEPEDDAELEDGPSESMKRSA